VFAAIEVIRSEGVSVPPVQQDAERALEISALAHLLGEGRILAGITDELRRSAEVRRSVLGP
jgi:ABC-type branched-subunit amino acid transport system ATPase component